MITVHVNDTPIQVNESTNVLELLNQVNQPIEGIAVAINNNIVSKSDWKQQNVIENDNVLIIQATQGG